MNVISISQIVMRKIENHLDSPSPGKIAAIKLLRAEARLGLKEAKWAIEKLQHEKFGANYPQQAREGMTIIVGPRIKKLVVNMGEGDVELDLEEMQMKVLSKLQLIGLDACGELLDLVQALKAFSDGKKIGVIENDT